MTRCRYPQAAARSLLVAAVWVFCGAVAAADYAEERAQLIEDIRDRADYAKALGLDVPELDARVLEAMERVPRHEFVPRSVRGMAYEDRPLSIGSGQTISQPFIVALMTTLLNPAPDDRVLEVGTGSGYQAAVLAEVTGTVYTIELVAELARTAKMRLDRLDYDNIRVRAGNGYNGWPEAAPFDKIIVTAGADAIPPKLLEQLKSGGRMVIPVGTGGTEQLTLVTKDKTGRITREELMAVQFVPLIPPDDEKAD